MFDLAFLFFGSIGRIDLIAQKSFEGFGFKPDCDRARVSRKAAILRQVIQTLRGQSYTTPVPYLVHGFPVVARHKAMIGKVCDRFKQYRIWQVGKDVFGGHIVQAMRLENRENLRPVLSRKGFTHKDSSSGCADGESTGELPTPSCTKIVIPDHRVVDLAFDDAAKEWTITLKSGDAWK